FPAHMGEDRVPIFRGQRDAALIQDVEGARLLCSDARRVHSDRHGQERRGALNCSSYHDYPPQAATFKNNIAPLSTSSAPTTLNMPPLVMSKCTLLPLYRPIAMGTRPSAYAVCSFGSNSRPASRNNPSRKPPSM